MIALRVLLKRIFLLSLLISLVNSNFALYAETNKKQLLPNEIIMNATENLLIVIDRDRDKIKKSPQYVFQVVEEYLVPHIDFRTAARWVLGKYEIQATKQQRSEFIDEFRTLMVRFYTTALREYLINAETKITKKMIKIFPLKLKDGADRAIVRSEIRPSSGKNIPVHFKMHLKKSKWKIYDVSVDGVSLITTYRASYSSQIRRKGLASVISSLKKRNASLK